MAKIPDYEIFCKSIDSDSTNLNEKFASYGCDTLEAKVPVVNRPVIDEIKNSDANHQVLAALALKSESASWALKGRAPRTRNKELRVVEVNGEVMLEAGEERDRSPVDRGELDDDLEAYARERARIKAIKMGINFDEEPIIPQARVNNETKKEAEKENGQENWDEEAEPEQEDLDEDLDRYMQEAARKRAQKQLLVQQTDTQDIMMRFEEDEEL